MACHTMLLLVALSDFQGHFLLTFLTPHRYHCHHEVAYAVILICEMFHGIVDAVDRQYTLHPVGPIFCSTILDPWTHLPAKFH